MKAQELRRQFIDFFVKKHGHSEIIGASLIPENDPTVLFTTAGMHPLVPFLQGEPHPAGKRLVDVQKCVRTGDIDEVGDATHLTFFEMLGNWSLGDYFKEEAIKWSYEFMTTPISDGGLGLDPDRLAVTCFEGDEDCPRDDEAASIWESLGFVRNEDAQPDQMRRIFFYNKKENWWGPAGQTGPCGPDTEMFYFTGDDLSKAYETEPSDDITPWVEIWNDVFMQFNKTAEGQYETLKQKNVDTGMGLERVLCILNSKNSAFETNLFWPVIQELEKLSKKTYASSDYTNNFRIVADHLRAATFIIGDPMGVGPSNKDQGYIVRRLIRRAIRHAKKLGIEQNILADIANIYIQSYSESYPELLENADRITSEMTKEEEQFRKTLDKGEREFEKLLEDLSGNTISGESAFHLYDTYGFPIEMTEELAKEKGLTIDRTGFDDAFAKHQDTSRAGAEQKFAGGLLDHSDECKMLHTATHLLHQALREVLGDHVGQKGSNITRERLRFDFNHDAAMTPEQKQRVEDIVNEQIKKKMPIHFELMDADKAKANGVIGIFDDKYAQLGNQVKVYIMGDYSKEICGGPHMENTGDLKSFKIKKEESCGAGIRRIKAVVGV